MAKNKTNETDQNVTEFLNKVDNDTRRADGFKLLEFFQDLTGFEAKMWGPTIIGFGSCHYKYASGHEGDMPRAAFSPRKASLVLYFENDYQDKELLLSKLGKHKVSKACVYVNKLTDIDMEVLKQLVLNSMAKTSETYG